MRNRKAGCNLRPQEIATLFRARRSGNGKWRARCPVHKSRNLTLAIYSNADRVGIYCHAGCAKDDILAAIGLTWKDTLYQPIQRLDREAWVALQRAQEQKESHRANIRIGEHVLRFMEHGYTVEDRERDITAVAAAVHVLSNREVPYWREIFRIHMERIAAADHCRERRVMPNC
jgi:hypothetical protein